MNPKDELFRLTVAWCAGIAGCFLYVLGVLYLVMK